MTDAQTVTVSRDLFVPREIVFELFSNPDHLPGWYAPALASDCQFSLDLTGGGSRTFAWTDVSGSRHTEYGDVIAVEKPGRLAYRCVCTDPGNPMDGDVTVTLTDAGGSTRIGVVQSGLPTEAAVEGMTRLWRERLAALESYLSSI